MFELDFLVFMAAFGIAAFTPGSGIAAVVAIVLAEGIRRTLWFCVGIIAGDLAWLGLSLSGLAFIAQQIPLVFLAIKWAGISYLLYLALKLWRSTPRAVKSYKRSRERGIPARILTGFSITMGNPKAM